MEINLIITDVTRMQKQRVCIGAISEDWDSIRPVLPYPGILEAFLYTGDKQVIRPFSRITLDLIKPIIDPPHTEDWEFTKKVLDYRGLLKENHKTRFLKKILDPSVDSIFGTEVYQLNSSCYVEYGTGKRSLGTIKVKSIENVQLTNKNGNLGYRISFLDQIGKLFNLSVTDLSFRYYVKNLIGKQNGDFSIISKKIEEKLQKADTYLRIGLGRAWSPPESNIKPHCYMFITGVYSFPDYLEGKSFADFSYNKTSDGLFDEAEIRFG